MKINRLIAFCLLVAGISAQVSAQSPYSKFGYGLLNDNTTSAQRSMGGIGYGLNSGRLVNMKNPASYAFIDSLTFLFDMGVDYTHISSKQPATESTEAASQNQSGGGLDYVTMQFPVGKRFGASVGLVPFSSVGYSFGTEIANGVNAREGNGGFNQLYVGFAGKIVNGLSVGANVSYLFGNIINDIYTTTTSNSQSLFEQLTEVRDYRLEFGAQYSFNINADHRVTAGLVYSPKKSLLGKSMVTKYDVNADSKPDTIYSEKLRGNAGLPETWGAGVSYRWKNRLMVGLDVTYQPWSKCKLINFEGFDANKFADRYQINLGGEFTPNYRGNYLQRIAYRAGGFYNRDYVMVGNPADGYNHVKEYGLSVGFGLPTLSQKTVINLGFEFRHRQATPNPLLKENYFNIRLGINFNELWFFQNKLN